MIVRVNVVLNRTVVKQLIPTVTEDIKYYNNKIEQRLDKLKQLITYNQSINPLILLCQFEEWGCPDHPRQRLMYETYDSKNTKLIIQYISIKNNLKRS